MTGRSQRESEQEVLPSSFVEAIVQKRLNPSDKGVSDIWTNIHLRATLNALSAHLALLDSNGVICAVNEAWLRFARENGASDTLPGIGYNYLTVCREAFCQQDDPDLVAICDGIQAVLLGTREEYYIEYPCHSPDVERWFVMRVSAFKTEGFVGAIVAHEDITRRKQIEMKVRESEILYHSMVNEVEDYAIFALDSEGRVESWNRGAERLFGFTSEQIIGDYVHVYDLQTGKVRPYPQNGLEEVDERGRVEEMLWFEKRDGQGFQGDCTLTLRHGQEDQIKGYSLVIRDITEKKKLEEALQERELILRSYYEAAPLMMGTIEVHETDLLFIGVNTAAARFFGRTPESVQNRRGSELGLTLNIRREWIRHCKESARIGQSVRFEYSQPWRDQPRWLAITVTFLSRAQSGFTRYTFLGEDITERKLAEEALARQSEELYAARIELEEFAQDAAQSLTEPTRLITSYSQLLSRRTGSGMDEDVSTFLGFVTENALRLQGLVQGLLACARASSGEQTVVPVECEEMVLSLSEKLGPALSELGALLTHEPLPIIRGDPKQLRQLFQQLIENAIKFRGDAPLRIHIGVRRQRDEYVFSVRDNGIGMDSSQTDRIFRIFRRLHTSSEYPGIGVGLSLCQRIVRRHGGRIWVESQPQKGSTFYFSLPIYRLENN